MSEEFVEKITQAGDAVGDRFLNIEDDLTELKHMADANRDIFLENNRLLKEILAILKA